MRESNRKKHMEELIELGKWITEKKDNGFHKRK
jgi:hypothetical protein